MNARRTLIPLKLVVSEAESVALRRYLRRRRPLVSSSLALTEVGRELMPLGIEAVRRGSDVLARIDLIRVTELLLTAAAALPPPELRSLDAIHIATARHLGADLAWVVTYDKRMATAAESLGRTVVAPT